METLIVQWINQNVDILKYGAIAIGFAYSQYRRFVMDRLEDRRIGQKNEYVERMARHLDATEKREKDVLATLMESETDRRALQDDNKSLRQAVSDLHDTIERLKHPDRRVESESDDGSLPLPNTPKED